MLPGFLSSIEFPGRFRRLKNIPAVPLKKFLCFSGKRFLIDHEFIKTICGGNRMPVAISCECGKKLKAKDSLRGKKVKCPECNQPLTVPANEGSENSNTKEDELKIGEVGEHSSRSAPEKEAGPNKRTDADRQSDREPSDETDGTEQQTDPASLEHCPNCGDKLTGGDIVCLNCGTDLRTGEAVQQDDEHKYYRLKYWGKRVAYLVVLLVIGYYGYILVMNMVTGKTPTEKAQARIEKLFSETGSSSSNPQLHSYIDQLPVAGEKGFDIIARSLGNEDISDQARARGLQLMTLYAAIGTYKDKYNLSTLKTAQNGKRFAVAQELANLHHYRALRVLPQSFQKFVPSIKNIHDPFSQPPPNQIRDRSSIRNEVETLLGKKKLLARIAGFLLFEQTVGHTNFMRKRINSADLLPASEPGEKQEKLKKRAWYRVTGIWFDQPKSLRTWYQKNRKKTRTAWLIQALKRAEKKASESGSAEPSRQQKLAYIHHQLRLQSEKNIGDWSSVDDFQETWIDQWKSWWEDKQK